jgi:hypothetical protein
MPISPKPLRCALKSAAAAIVSDGNIDSRRRRRAANFNLNSRRRRVPGNIGQRLLHQPEKDECPGFGQCIQIRSANHFDLCRGQARAPFIGAILERRHQSEFVQADRAQLANQTPQDFINPIDIGYHRVRGLGNLRPILRGFPNRHRIQLDRIDVLAQFIVQIAGQSFTFMLLHVDILQCQSLIFDQGFGQLVVRRDAQFQLPLRLEISPGREPNEADGHCQENQRQLVELQPFVRPRPPFERFTDIEFGADHARQERGREHHCSITPGVIASTSCICESHM